VAAVAVVYVQNTDEFGECVVRRTYSYSKKVVIIDVHKRVVFDVCRII